MAFGRFGGEQGPGRRAAPVPASSEVREFMSWRVRRNRKRLERLEASAVAIQKCWRAFMARTLVQRMRISRAALNIQVRRALEPTPVDAARTLTRRLPPHSACGAAMWAGWRR